MEKKVLSIRLSEEFIEELKEIAREENRPLSNLIETVLKQFIASRNGKSHPTES